MADSFLIRIYRRDAKDPQCLVGLIEDVMLQETRPFKNFNELWEILRQVEKKKGVGRKKGDTGGITGRGK